MYWLDSLRTQLFGLRFNRRAKRASRQRNRSRSLGLSHGLRHEPLEERRLLSVNMVADINAYTQNSSPTNITDVGGTVYFTATSNTGNVELYKTDGTAGGTTQLTFGNRLSGFVDLTSLSGKLFFDANDSVFGHRTMYTSDGTVAGTSVFQPGGDTLDLTYADANTSTGVVGGKFYFEAYDGTNGFFDLWATDGTNAGTHPVQPSNANAPKATNLTELTNVGGKAYFEDYDTATSKFDLWKSDGTAAGTTMIADLTNQQPSNFTALGSKLYFEMYDSGASEYALWKSDGTAGGTTMVADVGTTSNQFYSLTPFGSSVYFQVYDPTDAPLTNYALWSSDGTAAHTGAFKFNGGATAVNVNPNTQMTVFGSTAKLYFAGYDSTHGYSLWNSDGSTVNNKTGAVQTGTPTHFNYNPSLETVVGTALYFVAANTNDANGYGLWKTDGTSANTAPVQTSGFARGANGINSYMTASGSKVFFTAYDVDVNGNSPHGYELWSSAGTDATTAMIVDINTTTYNSNPTSLVAVGGEIFFNASTAAPVNGNFLWQSDGTAANTAPVQTSGHVVPTAEGNSVAVGSTLFFTGIGANGYDLWTSGSGLNSAVEMFPTGTNKFAGIFDSSNGNAFANLGGVLYFGAYDVAGSQYALWKSDGTPGGTKVVQDLGTAVNQLSELTVVGGNLFWQQFDPTNGVDALWQYNGTSASQVADISVYGLTDLTAVGGSVFFQAYDSGAGKRALWTSDGSTTTNLMEFGGGGFGGLIAFNGKLFFAADDPTAGWTMWTSDGTVGGTTLFLSTTGQPVYVTGTPDFTIVGTELFGEFGSVGSGAVLGKTDGTAAGTVIVQLGTGAVVAQNPSNMANDNGTLVFNAYDPADGYELWQSDGTSAGTLLTADIYPGTTSGNPTYITTAGTQVFFNANDGVHGQELWVATLNADVVTAGISGPTDGVTEQHRAFVLTASDSNSGNNSAGFSFTVNWGDGTSQTVIGLSGISTDHQFATTGNFTISVTATNLADNVTSAAVTQIENITATEVQGGNLAVGGLAGNNAFAITKGTGSSFVLKDNVTTTLLNNFTPATGEEILLYPGNGTTTAAVNDTGTVKDSFTLGSGYVTFNKGTFVATTPTTWTVTGNNATAGNTFTIVGTATGSIVGGTGTNTYNVSPGGSLSGTLSGGSGTGNLLSYAKYTTGVVVDLVLASATAIGGGANNGIRGIRNVTGSSVGGDILVGDGNANKLSTLKGHNILIGGDGGGDTLTSSSKGIDILIAGTTSYDSNIAALQVILGTWKTSTTSNYSSVISSIETAGTDPLSASQVTDSGASDVADTLAGSGVSKTDWFFAHTAGGSKPNDTTTGNSGDTVTSI